MSRLPPNPPDKAMLMANCDGKPYWQLASKTIAEYGGSGPAGPQGPEGPQGVQGDQGIQGPAGTQGSQGIQGSPGNDGAPGIQGDTGPMGPPGSPGQNGLDGAQGIQGIQGIQGEQGTQGNVGPQGNPGPNEVTTTTTTTIAGLLKGSAGLVAQAVSDTDYASASKGVTGGDSHDHNGGDGAQIDHVNLANKGTNTHAQLDTHLAANAPHAGHEVTANKGAANGYAGLGAASLVPTAQLGTGTPSGSNFLRGDQTWATPPGGGGVPQITYGILHPLIGNQVWTNMPVALSFLFSTASACKSARQIDLTSYTQVRLRVIKLGVAGAAASKLILRYKAAPWTQAVANYSDIGTSEVSVAINVTNQFRDTGWINLVAGAKADVFVALLGSGGDAALDPVFGEIIAEFK